MERQHHRQQRAAQYRSDRPAFGNRFARVRAGPLRARYVYRALVLELIGTDHRQMVLKGGLQEDVEGLRQDGRAQMGERGFGWVRTLVLQGGGLGVEGVEAAAVEI